MTSGRQRGSEGGLLRAVGMWALAASIINVTIGGGIFRLPSNPDIAGVLGSAAPLAFIVCAVAMGLIVVCLADAGSRVPLTGGPYAYIETAFGAYPGFLAGVMLWLLGTAAAAAVATVFADNVARLLPFFGNAVAKGALVVGVLALLTVINIRGVTYGSRLNVVTTILKLLPLLLLVVLGAFAIQPGNLTWESTPSPTEVSRASIVLIFAFAGIETALVPSGEVSDPARTVPRAIFLAMTVVTVLYIAIQLVAQGVLGPDLVGSTTPLADAANRVMGPWGGYLLAIGVVVSTFGYLSGMTLATPRALFAFSRDGFLPGWMSAVDSRFHTPYVALVIQFFVVAGLTISGSFEPLVIIANVAALLLYLACCAASWELRRRNVRIGGISYRVRGTSIAAPLAIIAIVYMLTSITMNEWMVLLAVAVVATIIFLVTLAHRRRLPASQRRATS
ncbi:MAG: APC family permease [Gemmatimonadaceae bacterium]|nr:APC family permease [Gemmatimonadaceae bacterium]